MQAIQSLKTLGMVKQGFLTIAAKNFPVLPNLFAGIRLKHSKRIVYDERFHANEGGVHYDKFAYFPRHPDQVDPPYEPTKLLMVRRIRAMKRKPYWEIDILEEFKITKRRSIAIVKNTPETNARLYKIKHLIEIKPITFKFGFPQDSKQGFLKENGEVIAYNLLESDKMELEQAEEQFAELKKKSVCGPTLKHRLRMNWFSRW